MNKQEEKAYELRIAAAKAAINEGGSSKSVCKTEWDLEQCEYDRFFEHGEWTENNMAHFCMGYSDYMITHCDCHFCLKRLESEIRYRRYAAGVGE